MHRQHASGLIPSLYATRTVAFNLGESQPTYIMDMASPILNPAVLAVSGSNGVIKIYDRSTLALVRLACTFASTE